MVLAMHNTGEFRHMMIRRDEKLAMMIRLLMVVATSSIATLNIGRTVAAADDVVVKAAIGDLHSDVVAVRRHAVNRLGRIGDRAVTPVLLHALADTDPGVRREAAKTLGPLRDPRSVAALVEALRDTDKSVRFHAAYALGEIKDARATEALLASLRDPAWPVRDQATWALREIGGERLAERLVALLVQEQDHLDVKQLAWVLQRLDRKTVLTQLSNALPAKSVSARARILVALGALHDTRTLPMLLKTLSDPTPRIRKFAVVLLVSLHDQRALEPLSDLARHDADAAVRESAQRAVQQLSHNSDLLAHWSFEKVQGGVVQDTTGNGNDGQVIGCAAVPGRQGMGLQFGPGQFVELGNPPGISVGHTPFTVTAWVKTRATDGVVVARGGAFCGFSLYLKESIPKFGIHRLQNGPGFIASGRRLPSDEWTHLAGVVKQDRVELYVNGTLAASTPTPGFLPSECGQGMEIGFDVANSAAEIVTALNGVIDEVKVFGVALSAEQVKAEVAVSTRR